MKVWLNRKENSALVDKFPDPIERSLITPKYSIYEYKLVRFMTCSLLEYSYNCFLFSYLDAMKGKMYQYAWYL